MFCEYTNESIQFKLFADTDELYVGINKSAMNFEFAIFNGIRDYRVESCASREIWTMHVREK